MNFCTIVYRRIFEVQRRTKKTSNSSRPDVLTILLSQAIQLSTRLIEVPEVKLKVSLRLHVSRHPIILSKLLTPLCVTARLSYSFCNIINNTSHTMLKRVGVSAAQNLLGSKAGPSKTTVLGKMTTNKSQARNMLFGRTYQ